MPEPTTDFGIFDHRQLVEWVWSGGTVENIRAVRRPLTQTVGRRIEQFISLNATDVVFHLDAAPLAGVAIAVNDELVAGGVTYAVIFFEFQSFDTTVLVVCRPV